MVRFLNTSLQHQVWSIAWPMALANIAVTLVGLVDTAILGHLENSSFIGGAAVATTLFNLIFLGFGFLRMGTTGLVAQQFGEGNSQGLYTTFFISSSIAIFFGFLVFLLRNLIFDYGFSFIGGSEAVQTQAFIYSEIRVLSSAFVLFNFVGVGLLIGIQRSRAVLFMLVTSQALNVVLDYYLAIYLGWGIEGVAWATVISDVFASIVALLFVFPYLKQQKIVWRLLENGLIHAKKIFQLNKDIFIRTVLLLSIFAFVTAQGARQGDIILAANAIIIQLFFFIANIIDGFANAAESTTGAAVGLKNKRQQSTASKNSRHTPTTSIFLVCLFQATVITSLTLVILFGFLPTILNLLTNLPEIILTIDHYIVWLAVLMFTAITCFVMDGVFIGVTRSREMLYSILFSATFAFFPCWYLSQGLENHGLWLSLCVFMLVRSALTLFYLRRITRPDR